MTKTYQINININIILLARAVINCILNAPKCFATEVKVDKHSQNIGPHFYMSEASLTWQAKWTSVTTKA